MLYAGTTWIISFKYLILNDIVKKLKQWSISAGNIFIKNGTSETLCNEIVVNTNNINVISVHVPKHLKPVNDDQFGHYLAGLIDSKGHFSNRQQLVIEFDSLDASLAYFIKKRLGYGKVKKINNKNALLFIVAANKGIINVINLINGKFRTDNIFNQITNNILNHDNFVEFNKQISLIFNSSDNFYNHWLAGFSDGYASFQITISNLSDKYNVTLNFNIDQKYKDILTLIQNFWGGNLNKDLCYYCSSSFGSAKNIINYFDKFHLLSSRHVNYLKWRKAFIFIQNESPLSKERSDKILKLKNTMNRLNDTTI